MQDLETVVDVLELERFPLVGVSQGGPVAVEYARPNPDRVSHLILIGAFVKGQLIRATTPGLEANHELQRNLIRAGWGLDDPSHRLYFTSTFMPDAVPELWADFAVLLRRTTSAENALRIVDACATIDVGEAATQVTAPTLILHAHDELRIPFGEALSSPPSSPAAGSYRSTAATTCCGPTNRHGSSCSPSSTASSATGKRRCAIRSPTACSTPTPSH